MTAHVNENCIGCACTGICPTAFLMTDEGWPPPGTRSCQSGKARSRSKPPRAAPPAPLSSVISQAGPRPAPSVLLLFCLYFSKPNILPMGPWLGPPACRMAWALLMRTSRSPLVVVHQTGCRVDRQRSAPYDEQVLPAGYRPELPPAPGCPATPHRGPHQLHRPPTGTGGYPWLSRINSTG